MSVYGFVLKLQSVFMSFLNKEDDTMNGMPDELQVLTAKDLIKVLHIGRDRAYSLVKEKHFPSVKIGSRYIVTLGALKEWIKKQEGKHN